MNIFDMDMYPMLLNSANKSFDDINYIFELKLDGIRCLAFCDKNKTILKNRHLKIINEKYPELCNIYQQCNENCILDGEIVYLDEKGFPNFNTLQKRSLLTSKFKILYQSKLIPVCFVAFDILFCKNDDLTHLPLMKRKNILSQTVKENSFISISRYIERYGKNLFKSIKKLNLEGIVAKKKNSFYFVGERSSNWIKIKNTIFEDYIICGFTIENGEMRDIIIAKKEDGILKYDGIVYIGAKEMEKKIIWKFAQKNKVAQPIFKNLSDDITWIRPQLVCTVEYLQRTKSNQRRQPIFRGLRTD